MNQTLVNSLFIILSFSKIEKYDVRSLKSALLLYIREKTTTL